LIDVKPKSSATCIAADDGQSCILVHESKPVWTVVNEVGYKTVSLCDGCNNVEQIAHILSQGYGVPLDPVLSDVQSFTARLAQGGFLLSSEPARSTVEQPSEQIPALKKVDLNITGNCNLLCRHCGIIDGSVRKDAVTTEQIFKIIDEARDAGIKDIAISGGEPLLRKDCLDILSYAVQRANTLLATNATLIDERTARILADLGLRIQISLDGAQESIHDFIRGRGAFARTLRALDLLSDLGVNKRVSICSTISKNNLRNPADILKLAAERGIAKVRFSPLQSMGMARLHWNELAPSTEDYIQFYNYMYSQAPAQFPGLQIDPGLQGFLLHHPPGQASWCPVGEALTMDDQGDLYPCPLFMKPSFRLGNVREISLQQAFDSQLMAEIRKMCLLRRNSIPECQVCSWKNFCQGGCPASVYHVKGTLQAVDDLCEFRKKFYPQIIFSRAARKSRSFSNTSRGRDEGGRDEEDRCA